LLDKIESQRKARADAERSRLEKIRRQKRQPSRAAKDRMRADKAHRAFRKEFRRRVGPE
jgi:hypothetical protein